MIPGFEMANALVTAGVTHVIWIPDSHLGAWDDALTRHPGLTLIRPTREGEAIAIAAGLLLGGACPIVMIQCTGFFEAGDAIRNVIHDLGLSLKLIVGVRSWTQRVITVDNCPNFAEPLVRAWNLPFEWFDPFSQTNAAEAIGNLIRSTGPRVLLWGE